jgi:hypothetical protein
VVALGGVLLLTQLESSEHTAGFLSHRLARELSERVAGARRRRSFWTSVWCYERRAGRDIVAALGGSQPEARPTDG